MKPHKTTSPLADAMASVQQHAAGARTALHVILSEARRLRALLDADRRDPDALHLDSDQRRVLDTYSQALLEAELTAECYEDMHWANSLESRLRLICDAERHVAARMANGDLEDAHASRIFDALLASDVCDENDMRLTQALAEAQDATAHSDECYDSDEGYDPYENRYTEDC